LNNDLKYGRKVCQGVLMSFLKVSLRSTEIFCWTVGLLLVGFFVSQLALGEAERIADVAAFEKAYPVEAPDQSLWSESRIKAYAASKDEQPARVAAVLSMPGIGLKVPVYESVSDFNLNRGVGLIEGTAAPDEVGNVGIAGHRDGYFRVLKDVKIGDRLIMQTPQGLRRYQVTETLIVDPGDVEVLDPTEDHVVTLVTCYPFYFVGSAPRRFIVKAQLEETES
jgi:sortase A